MKRFTLIALLFFFLVGCTSQTTSGAQVAEGNRLYEAGQFVEAAALYQALADAGAEDGTLYYNLGNACFKAGDLGRAILNYRRAQALLPRDPDVADDRHGLGGQRDAEGRRIDGPDQQDPRDGSRDHRPGRRDRSQ